MAAISNATAAPGPGSITEAAGLFGGTRGLAEALGVTQRSVQRYIKHEKGEGGEARKPGADILAKAREAGQEKAGEAALRKMRNGGLSAAYKGEANGSNEDGRVRAFSFDVAPGDALDALLDAYEDGDRQTAAMAFEDALAESYAPLELGDVQALTVRY